MRVGRASLTLSRREFLAAAAALPVLAAACTRRPYDAAAFALPSGAAVGLFPAASYSVDFADVISRGLKELGVNLTGRRVFLKPNMVEYEPGTAINTHPNVVTGAILACRQAGVRTIGSRLQFTLDRDGVAVVDRRTHAHRHWGHDQAHDHAKIAGSIPEQLAN